MVGDRVEGLVGTDARLEQECSHGLVLLGLCCLAEGDELGFGGAGSEVVVEGATATSSSRCSPS